MSLSVVIATPIALNVQTTLKTAVLNAQMGIILMDGPVKNAMLHVLPAMTLDQCLDSIAVINMVPTILVIDATGVTSLMLPSIAPLHHTLTQAISAEMIAQRTQLVTIMY